MMFPVNPYEHDDHDGTDEPKCQECGFREWLATEGGRRLCGECLADIERHDPKCEAERHALVIQQMGSR
jgi:hypothetical protein